MKRISFKALFTIWFVLCFVVLTFGQKEFIGNEVNISPSVQKISANEWEVILPANLQQLDTENFANSIFVRKGQTVIIMAKGKVNASGYETPDDGAYKVVGPNGWCDLQKGFCSNPEFNSGRRSPLTATDPFMALAMRIGNGKLPINDEQWSSVGSQQVVTSNKDGYLHFTVNDMDDPTGQTDWWKNNEGALTIRVWIRTNALSNSTAMSGFVFRFGNTNLYFDGALENIVTCDSNCKQPTITTGIITGIEASNGLIREISIRTSDGKIERWNDLDKGFSGLWFSSFSGIEGEVKQAIIKLFRLGNRVKITSCECGSGVNSNLKSIQLETAPQSVTTTGYVDVVENNDSGCRIRIIAGEKVYSGVITFDRLSSLTKRKINSCEDAVSILGGKKITIDLSGMTSSNGNVSDIDFENITQITFPVIGKTKPPTQTWNEQTTNNETIINLSTDILFDFDKATIKPNAVPTLIRLARLIRQSKGIIQLNGFTDSKGTDEYNLDLSERRAASVKQWLVNKGGIDAERLQTKGYGESQPVVPNTKQNGLDNPIGRQKNRRVEVRIPRN